MYKTRKPIFRLIPALITLIVAAYLTTGCTNPISAGIEELVGPDESADEQSPEESDASTDEEDGTSGDASDDGDGTTTAPGSDPPPEPPADTDGRLSNYAVYYGPLTDEAVDDLRRFELVIVHPNLNLSMTTAEIAAAVERIAAGGDGSTGTSDDVIVAAYISVGEDFRPVSYFEYDDAAAPPGYHPDWSQVEADSRFYDTSNSSFVGPVLDPRGAVPDGGSLDGYYTPDPSNGGYASFYLDDGDRNNNGGGDGKPDYNVNFGAFFVNVGDPVWYRTLRDMSRERDGLYGIEELVGKDGLGFDGLFLDTVDTMGPNSYTDTGSPVPSEYEWTAPGFEYFLDSLTRDYPEAVIIQNRGLFFYDPRLQHYEHHPGEYIDYVMFESYRLDSDTSQPYNETFYRENSKRVRQALMVEASRPDGFEVLSLGYAEGPGAETEVPTDIAEATSSGFVHYITNAELTEIRFDSVDAREQTDDDPPVWSSTGYANFDPWPDAYTDPLVPRVGLQGWSWGSSPGYIGSGFRVIFDIALDREPVRYVAYLYDLAAAENSGAIPEDVADPDWWSWAADGPEWREFFGRAERLVLDARVSPAYAGQYAAGTGYTEQNEPPPAHYAELGTMEPNRDYLILLRAVDAAGNETTNRNLAKANWALSP